MGKLQCFMTEKIQLCDPKTSFHEADVVLENELMGNSEIMKVIGTIAELLKAKSPKPVVIALDGRSGTGKTTIANLIAKQFAGIVIGFDDFYPGGTNEYWDNLDPGERMDQVIDWKKLVETVLRPLLDKQHVSWHPFDVATCAGPASFTEERDPAQLIILEGQYSNRPELRSLIDYKILVRAADDSVRRQRLVSREGSDFMDDWHPRWDPAEEFYYRELSPDQVFDAIITNH